MEDKNGKAPQNPITQVLRGLNPPLLKGEGIRFAQKAEYLTVVFVSKLTWRQHLQKIRQKMETWKPEGVECYEFGYYFCFYILNTKSI